MTTSKSESDNQTHPDATGRDEPRQNGAEIPLSRFSTRQILALPILAVTPSRQQAAVDIGVNERTLRRWLHDEHFRAELNRLTEEAAEFTRQEFQDLTRKSFKALNELTEDPNPDVRLRASLFIAFMGSREGNTHSIHGDTSFPVNQTET